MKISGKIIDIHSREIYPGEIYFTSGIISSIERVTTAPDRYIMPGLIDSHVHIESSMVTPGAFARAAVSRGTTGTVSDPHEIANVLGIDGVRYMIRDAGKVPLKFNFGAPSCVPATSHETSGAHIGRDETAELMALDEIKYLSEMMNFPGVIYDNPEVWGKIEIARRFNKPIDGHAPGLSGEMLKKYISAGISTDHECSLITEAREKISLGMKVLIREGSAARNMEELKDLMRTNPDMVMLCSDDIHPEMLVKGHINKLVAELNSDGYNVFDVIRSCTLNPVKHYNLDSGLLQPGQPADFIITGNYYSMDIMETWIDGRKVFGDGKILFDYTGADPVNKFNSSVISTDEISILNSHGSMRVIQAYDGELTTKEIITGTGRERYIKPDITRDVLKIVVKDRYNDTPPAVGFINGFGLRSGAFASSVAHDSHNIICVGTNDKDIVSSINEVVKMQGGLSVTDGKKSDTLKLEIAGIMSGRPIEEIALKYQILSEKVKSLGCKMTAPFMTLSFMALLVIPELKLSDRGLFDGKTFSLVPLFAE